MHSRKILEFWRNIEIFHLPDLDADAVPLSSFEHLPWETNEPMANEKMSRRFTLYIGRVAKNDVIDYLKKITKDKSTEDWMEPVTGYTCLAAITLDEFGRPFWNSYVQTSYIHGINCLLHRKPLSGVGGELNNTQAEFEKRYNVELKTPLPGEEGTFIRKGDVVSRELLKKEIDLLQKIVGEDFLFEKEVYWNSKEVMSDNEVEVPILNSFYLDDLNMLIGRHQYGRALSEYLSEDVDPERRIDMIESKQRLANCLHPNRLPAGRWPSSIENGLYTAQQAAVNTALSELKPGGGLIGINGPPGTGKTTLLLDIISDLVVGRARKLLEMDPLQIFKMKAHTIHTETDHKHYYYDYTDSELFAGHGIVVASNNNKAVENISMELPAADKIDRKSFPDAGYFIQCASKLLDKKDAWGVLSARLGNAKNKNAFKWSFWESDDLFPGFKDFLYNVYRDRSNDQTDVYVDLFEQTKEELSQLLNDFLTFTESAGKYQTRILKTVSNQKGYASRGKSRQHKNSADNLKNMYGLSVANLVDFDFLEKDYAQLHIGTPYSSPEVNYMRSQIFIKSLKLHEYAILCNAKNFKCEISLFMEMLTGRMKVPDDVAAHLWDTFFFCVPVVSTTLASSGRLFRQIGNEGIGWLLLDEAGQATPQSAAGIIFRSRNCIAVGDPLQIEPVVHHPEKLIKLLREEADVTDRVWSPLVSSVQTLSDRASTCGTYLQKEENLSWSGFPLRAHRRCDDPMFSISNSIAYNGQMVKATTDKEYFSPLGKTCWFDVAGYQLVGKHAISEEINALRKLMNLLLAQYTKQEIFVISPFTSVRDCCKEIFEKNENVKCGTVHAFQGREADIVFLVLGSDPSKHRARKWVAQKPNLINVAVTRARRRFYVIGNSKLWSKYAYFNQFKGMLPTIRLKEEDLS